MVSSNNDIAGSDDSLIERSVYLASLTSSAGPIDKELDTLRYITSRREPGKPLAADDVQKLQALNARLEDYLVNEDPVRAFTKESLRQKISQNLKEPSFYARPILSLMLVVAASIVLGSLAFLLPSYIAQNTKVELAMSLFFFGTHCGNIWFFMTALKNFRKELHLAFRLLVAGVFLVGIVGAQFTLINLFGFSESPWTQYGGFLFLFPFAYIFLLAGVYLFARQLNVVSRFMSLKLLAVLCAATVLFALVPNKAEPDTQAYFMSSVIGIAIASLLIGWTAAIAHKTTKLLTLRYARAMRFLSVAFFLICITGIGMLAALLAFGQLSPSLLAVTLVPVLIAEPLELLAGYTFKKRADE